MDLTSNQKQSIVQSYLAAESGDYRTALSFLGAALKDGDQGVIYALQTRFLTILNKQKEALATINEGIEHNFNDHILYAIKAGIYAQAGDYEKAVDLLRIARDYYQNSINIYQAHIDSIEPINTKVSNSLRDLLNINPQLIDLYLIDYARITDVNNVFRKIQETEEKLEKEKSRTVEIIALFTAVIAFIFSNIQKMPTIESPEQLLEFNIVLGSSLSIFALLISVILGPQETGIIKNYKLWMMLTLIIATYHLGFRP